VPNLTKRAIDALAPGKAQAFVWDSETRGFGVLTLPSGVKSFVVQYRNSSGRSRRMTIGRYGTFTVDQARKEAQVILVAVARGGDPAHDRRTKKHAPDVNALLDRYLLEHVDVHNAETTRLEVRRLVDKEIRPRIGHLKTDGANTSDVAKLHGDMQSTPRQANFVLSIVSKAFNLAELWHLRPAHSNPTLGIKRYEEVERERFLTAAELKRLGEVLALARTEGLPWIIKDEANKHLPKNVETFRTVPSRTAIAAILLLMFTGARLSEILQLEWRHFEEDAKTVALPGRKGKERKAHPVSEIVVELLGGTERRAKWVLPRDRDPKRHISKSVVESTWQKLRHHAQLDDVRIHDLRHTAGTIAGRTGNAFAVMHLLRHRNVTTTTKYVNTDADPIRDLSETMGRIIASSLSLRAAHPEDGSNG
jgi:integrase